MYFCNQRSRQMLILLSCLVSTSFVSADEAEIGQGAPKRTSTREELYENALASVDEAIKNGKTSELICKRAQLKYGSHDFEGAIADCDELIKDGKGEHLAIAHACRGLSRFQLGDVNRAISDCTVALDVDPKCGQALMARSLIWSDLEHDDLAILDLNLLIQMYSHMPDFYIARSRCFQSQQKWNDALADANKAIELDNDDADWYIVRGYAREGHGAHREALRDFEKAVELDCESDTAVAALAVYLTATRDTSLLDYPRAIKLVEELCAESEWSECFTLSLLASIYAQSNDFAQAIKIQQKAVAFAPDEKVGDAKERLELYKQGKKLYSAEHWATALPLSNWR